MLKEYCGYMFCLLLLAVFVSSCGGGTVTAPAPAPIPETIVAGPGGLPGLPMESLATRESTVLDG